MPNPFDRTDAAFLALLNDQGQWSLWPAQVAVPVGWRVAHGPDERAACLDHIETAWTDLRPAAVGHSSRGAKCR